MNLTTRELDDALLISTEETRIDAASAIQFKDAMRDAFNCAQDRILLDLSYVTFIDSSGLGAIVAGLKQLPPGKSLELCALTPAVQKVFQLTRMDSVFTIHADVPVATGLRNAS